MSTKATYYHAGCPVCIDAERTVVEALDRTRFDIDIVHLGNQPERIDEADRSGVTSVPALVIDGHACHINHGADLSALRES